VSVSERFTRHPTAGITFRQMPDRRFNEAEVSAIFERATEAPRVSQGQTASGDGMTLAELQAIGREVGISPEQIAAAAQSLDRAPLAPRRMFGLPMGVERTVELNRRLSDEEWEQLVVLLRDTFKARGRVGGEGSLRQWTNGNLQALLEPTPTGQRVRLRTFKSDGPPRMAGGLAMLGIAVTGLTTALLTGGDLGTLAAMGALGAMGATMIGSAIVGLPRWARLRQQQMEEVAAKLESGER
jgi:hypothetical protein